MRIFLFIIIYILLHVNLLFALPSTGKANENPFVSAEQAVVMDQISGRVLFTKNAHENRPVASITKVMTAIIALELGDLASTVTVSKRAAYMEGSSIYLQEKERIKLEDLLYGLMLRSGNDAAVAIAEHIAGSVEGFTHLMNEKAMYLGMTDTTFQNPHGLDEKEHLSTAYDIALLMRYAMNNEIFQEISSSKSYLSKNRDYKWFNKNKLLTRLYEYCTGGKTGFTKKAGRTLVSTASKDNHSLIVVTLNAPDDWNDHILLYENYFKELKHIIIDEKGKFIIAPHNEQPIIGRLLDSFTLSVREEEIPLLSKQVVVYQDSIDNQIGMIHYYLDDEHLRTLPIYQNEKSSQQHLSHTVKKIILKIMKAERYG